MSKMVLPDFAAHAGLEERKPWRSYKERIAGLAGRIVEAQAPIRVLDGVKWGPAIYEAFRKSGHKTLPKIEYPLSSFSYDPAKKKAELKTIEEDIRHELGDDDPIVNIMCATAREYRLVVEMLEARGTRRFYELSRQLYGSAMDHFADGGTTVKDVAHDLYAILTQTDDSLLG